MKKYRLVLCIISLVFISIIGIHYLITIGDTSVKVLMYHHLLYEEDMPENPSIISVENFREQMQYLYDNGYQTITNAELEAYLYEGLELPGKSIMITFDDGYQSNYIYAYPILKEFGFNAVLFPLGVALNEETIPVFNPNTLDYMSFEELEAASDVFEYGAHTYNMHRMRDGVADMIRLDDSLVETDLLVNQLQLGGVTSFAYPFGAYDRESIESLRRTNFSMAYTTKKGNVTKRTNPYEIPRYGIYQETTMEQFIKMVR